MLQLWEMTCWRRNRNLRSRWRSFAMPKRKKPISSVRERGSTFFENAAIHGEMFSAVTTLESPDDRRRCQNKSRLQNNMPYYMQHAAARVESEYAAD